MKMWMRKLLLFPELLSKAVRTEPHCLEMEVGRKATNSKSKSNGDISIGATQTSHWEVKR